MQNLSENLPLNAQDGKILALSVFISLVESPPNKEILNELESERMWENWIDKNSSPMQKSALKLLDSNESAESIGSDFVRLFISDIEFVKAPPFASFYLDKSNEIYSINSDLIKALYERHNFAYDSKNPADSLLNELGFTQFLLLHNDFKILGEFLESELLAWIFVWCKCVQNGAESKFYQGLGMLMEDYFSTLQSQNSLTPQKRTIFVES